MTIIYPWWFWLMSILAVACCWFGYGSDKSRRLGWLGLLLIYGAGLSFMIISTLARVSSGT